MSITYKEGCLIQGFKRGEVQAIGHQANCQNTMGSGVAKAIRAKSCRMAPLFTTSANMI